MTLPPLPGKVRAFPKEGPAPVMNHAPVINPVRLAAALLSLPLALGAASAAHAAEIAPLPLPAGYYTEAGEVCGEGNDATLLHLHGAGFTNRFGLCSFDAVSAEGTDSYSYAVTCEDAEQGLETLNEGRITLTGKDSFHIFDGLMDLEYSYCPASELPAPYGND